jgi:hypothetical protein
MLRSSRIVVVAAVVALVGALAAGSPSVVEASEPVHVGPGCTVIYAADGQVALGGNNEDGFNPLTKIWFVPGSDGGYGSAWVGYDDLVIQGGMNEAGLFFDGLAVREVTVPPKPGKPELTGGSAWTALMSRCSSVDCVRQFYDDTSLPGTWNGQALFGDRYGNSAIVEPLTIIPKEGAFQVATNFFQSEIPAADRTDERYVIATSMLEHRDRFSADLMRDVLHATSQQGDVNTLYSTVYDLNVGTIDLYYFQDFGKKITFDLRTELAKGIHGYDIPALFPPSEAADRVAAPIRGRIAAALGKIPEVAVTNADLARFVGTYEAPAATRFEAKADGNILLGRQSWSPWVPLRPASTTTFWDVFSDPTGAVTGVQMQFTGAADEAAAAVEISDGSGNRIVATRIPTSGPSAPDLSLFVAVAVAVGLIAVVGYWTGQRRHPHGVPAAAGER